VENKGKF